MPHTHALIPETLQFDLTPHAGGEPYRVFLRIPPEPAPENGWPALYLLDANAVIGIAVDALRVQSAYPLGTGICSAAIVGIGYPTEKAYDSVRRSWDMGPPPGRTYPPHVENGPDVRTGGADLFLAFIEDELKPQIARRLPVDTARQAIFGHSFGGLFVLHALFNRPAAFATWIAISPAIWWEDSIVLRSAERFEQTRDPELQTRILLAAGEFEQNPAPFQKNHAERANRIRLYGESRVNDNAKAMAERLAALPGVQAEFVTFEGETHMSVLPVAINRAIRFALGSDAASAIQPARSSAITRCSDRSSLAEEIDEATGQRVGRSA